MTSSVVQESNPKVTQDRSRTQHHQIVIVGGGAAGITVASHLFNQARSLDIAIIEPSEKHYYQPGWTLVGGGLMKIEETVRAQKDFIPKGTTWIKDSVTQLDPDHNIVITQTGKHIEYDYLILCPGIQIDWHLIEGLKEALGKNGVTSNYSPALAPYTWESINSFQGGTAIFTFPNTPIKCGGAPQKVMYMADDVFKSKSGVGTHTKVIFCSALTRLFGVEEYCEGLEKVVARRGIDVKFQHNLKAIKADTKEAIFTVITDEGIEEVSIHYDMIHVTPPMSAPDFIKKSPLAVNSAGGWVDVHPETLQHYRYPNVFSLGDASSVPTARTAAAARKEAPVLVKNLLAVMDGTPQTGKYDGYSCCPLITGYNSAIMAEFNYGCHPAPTFPLDPAKERYIMFFAKVYALPWIYWHRMLKGKPFETDLLKPFNKFLGR
ncbi:MAG: hypothetical protein RLZZ338_254 [Cyanobacteriota bacterium]|jgi:sulfide:quinone oxidoreductase